MTQRPTPLPGLVQDKLQTKKTCFKKQVFRMMVGEKGLRASAMLALRANAQALFKTVPDSFVFILL
ncbi:hypothetical protein HMPREF0758_1523 [Serratia odorifera DSM 4582]|uniref:Uncharacterized protein n=2 Tax=Serratia odorifera TaxID=618 RepID=D4E023_SEROD|nr:hypothetical protein HMPREF0758_1523 [Serratia odorifera DSM 4582]